MDHLIELARRRHAGSGTYFSETLGGGRFVLVHAAGNTHVADACKRYRDLLRDQSTFSSMTVEDLLDADVLPARTAAALRKRYIPRWASGDAEPVPPSPQS